MNKLTLLISILLGLLVVGYSFQLIAKQHYQSVHGYSQDHGRGNDKLNAKRIMRHLALLDLTNQQREEIGSLVKNAIESSKPKREEVEILHAQLKDIKESGKIDEQAIRTLASEIASIKSDLFILHLQKRKEMTALLTSEQLAKLARIKAARKGED